MKLKRLDIHGFKSFYHRTTVLFDDGITAIVGPNGCGKSNIVDAIKWVMGEQGPKNLRGAAMEDVIFGGTGTRGPMGMCEVRLTFENDVEKVVGDVRLDAGQIELERRLERTKGSDYFINRRRVRLSDIQDLLAGTGVGAGPGGRRAYAIIEQGQIERIVGAKADERRMFIEEAAGVTRYRQRRKIAERRMEETRLNLARVDDIIQEIERQMRSLRRQAKKAERFKTYRDEAHQIAVRALAEACQQFEEEKAALRTQLEARNQLHADAIVAVQASETRQSVAQLELKKCADKVAVVADALRTSEETAMLARERIAGHERERASLGSQLEQAHLDLERGEGRRVEIELEQSETAQRLAELESQSQHQSGEVRRAEQVKKEAVMTLLSARSKVERLMREESEEFQAMAQARARVDVALRRQRELGEEIERALARNERIQVEEKNQIGHAASLADAESSCRLEVEQAEENVASLEVKLSAVQSDL
ncbi:MAG: AAA family ATPase, partial [Myxococcota bacterium]|nr:AAA family ATPase [Myxococcota bacterium]